MNFKSYNRQILIFYYFFIIFFSFSVNSWVASRGVFPIDTFVHFDSSARILQGEIPVRDFWIVHGFLVDFIQSIFFKIFGYNWNAYVYHSSLFNVIISLFTFNIIQNCNINNLYSFILTICFSILAYPVSGTPFLDLHSAFFSLLAIYFLILFMNNKKNIYIIISVIFFGFAFLSKQVPAAYTIVSIAFFLIFYSFITRNFDPIKYSLIGIFIFITFISIIFFINGIDINDIFFQLVVFPSTIAQDRYSSYELNINNVFLNFKFIYFFLGTMTFFLFTNLIKKNINFNKDLSKYLIILIFTITLIYHQIFTKNQIFIFFIIPILCAFTLDLMSNLNIKKKKYVNILLIFVCVFSTLKYNERFNLDRKFHELIDTNLEKGVIINFRRDFFKNLKWVTPNFQEPNEEIEKIEKFYLLLKEDKSNKILISNYLFYSALLNTKLHSPSRTYDKISYPQKGSKYFEKYKIFFRKNIIENDIENIYIFYTQEEIGDDYLKMVILDYLPKECLKQTVTSKYIRQFKIKTCEYLQ